MNDESDDDDTYEIFDGVERSRRNQVDRDDRPDFTPEDRPRGILSQTDREYLCGLKEYAQPQTDANRRQDIRERVLNGMQDFVMLVFGLPEKEREKIFETLEAHDELEDVLGMMVAFVYLGLDKERPRFETVLERAILQAENLDKLFQSAGRATEVDVALSVEYNPDIDRLVGRLERGDELTAAEIGAVVKAGRLEPEQLDEIQNGGKEFPGIYIGGSEDPATEDS
jgi:hypothetical protein